MLVLKNKVALFILFCFILIGAISLLFDDSCFAKCAGVETSIINCSSDGSGAISEMLWNGLDIFSAVVGILGILGVTIVGIQYIRAAGNEQQTTKAKRRMYEIVIGLGVYALAFAGLKWLNVGPSKGGTLESISVANSNLTLPKGSSSGLGAVIYPLDADAEVTCKSDEPKIIKVNKKTCEVTALKNEGTAKITITATQGKGKDKKTIEKTVFVKATKKEEKNNDTGSDNSIDNSSVSALLNSIALKYAWPHSQKSSCPKPYNGFEKAIKSVGLIAIEKKYGASGGRAIGRSCAQFVSTIYRYSGIDKDLPSLSRCVKRYVNGKKQTDSSCTKRFGTKTSTNYKDVTGKTLRPEDVGKLQGGDILTNGGHTAMIVNVNGKLWVAEAGVNTCYGRVTSKASTWIDKMLKNGKNYHAYRYTGSLPKK